MNTPNTWSAIGFEIEMTEDNSPTLRQLNQLGESMHHSGGAAAETELIYGTPIHLCFRDISAPSFISVGFGLGYVELLIARESLAKGNGSGFCLESWEVVPELKDFFVRWLKDENLPKEVQKIYDSVASYIAGVGGADCQKDIAGERRASPSKVQILSKDLKALLLEKFQKGDWILRGALTPAEKNCLLPQGRAHGILFDAFSAKTTPELWTEEFLTEFFQASTHTDSFISTYASRTSLKKAFSASGFKYVVREGFKGKRNSTLAFKGKLEATFAPAETF